MNYTRSEIDTVNVELFSHIGQRVYTDEIDKGRNKRTFKVNCDFPLIHLDSDTGKTILKHISFDNLGEGEIIKSRIKLPKKNEVNQKIMERLNLWTEKSELMVVSATAKKLALLPETKFKLEPINDIMNYIYYYNYIPKEKLKRNIKAARYLALLEDIGLVKEKNDSFTHTKKLLSLMRKDKEKDQVNYKEFLEDVFAYVIDKSYPTLKGSFSFKALEQYVRIENSYYLSSVEAEKLLKIEKSDLITEYQNKYTNIPPQFINILKFTKDLHELARLGILHIQGSLVYGEKTIFDLLLGKRTYLVNHVRDIY